MIRWRTEMWWEINEDKWYDTVSYMCMHIYVYAYTHDNITWAKCNQFRGMTHQPVTKWGNVLISWQTSRAVSVK